MYVQYIPNKVDLALPNASMPKPLREQPGSQTMERGSGGQLTVMEKIVEIASSELRAAAVKYRR
jgi:hypothetical protein